MPLNLTILPENVTFAYPLDQDPPGWGQPAGATGWAGAVTTALSNRVDTVNPQAIGGLKDFITGVKSLYYSSETDNPANAGQIRLANAVDSISFRNAGNSANLQLLANANDKLSFGAQQFSNSFSLTSPSTDQTLTNSSANIQFITPTANINLILPTTNVVAGDYWKIKNLSTAFTITIKASGGTTIQILTPTSWVLMYPNVNTPTLNTHWNNENAGGGWISGGLVSGSFSASFGTVTNVQSFCRRNGANFEMTGEFTMGTTTGAVGRITAPFGLSLDTSQFTSNTTRFKSGEMIQLVSSSGSISSNLYHVTSVGGSPTLLYFSNVVAGAVYSDFVMNSQGFDNQVFNFNMSFPISGWLIK